jgi:ankyrin repeat protein
MSYTTITTTEQSRVSTILNGNLADFRRFINSTNINQPIDSLGNTPLHIAIMSKKRPHVKYLIERGADGRIQNKMEETAEELACRYFIPEYFEYQKNLLQNDLIDEREKVIYVKKQLDDTTNQVKTLKRKYEDLNSRYNDTYQTLITVQHNFDNVVSQNNTLKKQNDFYKSSNSASEARKKSK